jgi:hypothetical protein
MLIPTGIFSRANFFGGFRQTSSNAMGRRVPRGLPKASSTAKTYIILATVTDLRHHQFQDAKGIEAVEFESGTTVCELGFSFFADCTPSKSITIPASAKVTNSRFNGPEKLENVMPATGATLRGRFPWVLLAQIYLSSGLR